METVGALITEVCVLLVLWYLSLEAVLQARARRLIRFRHTVLVGLLVGIPVMLLKDAERLAWLTAGMLG